MRIALDARTIYAPRRRGTGRNLIDAYRRVPRLRPEWEFVLYHQHPAQDEPLGPLPNVRRRQVDMAGDRWHLWQEVRLAVAAWGDGARLLHCPANEAPTRSVVPTVVTIHDLIPLKVADELPPAETARFAAKIAIAARRARGIICVSAATRSDLLERHPECDGRVHVIPWAPDSSFTAEAESPPREQVKDRYQLSDRWLVAFSGQSRRKNARRLIEAFSRVPPASQDGTQLVLVGCEPEAFRRQLLEHAASLGVSRACRVVGYVPEADVPGLLRHSSGLVFASLYEGFGLPILDAFACDTPVLTSDTSSMPEVATDAAFYCRPDDTDSIAGGMQRLLAGGEAVQGLIERGRRRVADFSWETTAELMCRTYEVCAA